MSTQTAASVHYVKTTSKTFCGRPVADVKLAPSLAKVTCVRCGISGGRKVKADAARQARMFANND